MSCDDRGPDLVARLFGQLEPDAVAELDAHLAACAGCREELARAAAARETVHAGRPQPPPEGGLDRLLIAVRDEAAERRAAAALSHSPVCPGLGENLTALAVGDPEALDPVERSSAEDHVQACAPCAAEFRAARALRDATRAALSLKPSEDGLEKLVALVAAEGPAPVRFDVVPDLPSRRGRPSRLRLLGWLLPAAAAAAVLAVAVISNGPGPARVTGGAGILFPQQGMSTSRPAVEPSRTVDASSGPFAFENGDVLEAGLGAVTVRVDCTHGGGASRGDDSLAPGAAEFRLQPGARMERIDASHFELLAGRVEITAAQLQDALEVSSGDLFAAVRGTRFDVSAVGTRLVVVVHEGRVELGRHGRKAESIMLQAGEEGLADAERLLRRNADGRPGGDAFLTPTAVLLAPSEAVRVGEPLRLTAELRAAEAGPVTITAFDDSLPLFLVRLKGPTGPEREIKVQRAMLTFVPAGADGNGRTWRLAPDRPYRLEIEIPDVGTETGRWQARLRYMSYRSRSRGAEWLGVLESEPVFFEVTR